MGFLSAAYLLNHFMYHLKFSQVYEINILNFSIVKMALESEFNLWNDFDSAPTRIAPIALAHKF
jgi:hypothetical protein